MTLFTKKPHPAEMTLAEVRRLLRLNEARGEHERATAPSRSTGYRRQYKASHETLEQVRELLAR